MTEIERVLFRDGSAHAVVGITLAVGRIGVQVAPWGNLGAVVTAEFPQASVTSLDLYAGESHDLNLPWDIIGFDCHPLCRPKWRFVLHTTGLEYGFESLWPEVRLIPSA